MGCGSDSAERGIVDKNPKNLQECGRWSCACIIRKNALIARYASIITHVEGGLSKKKCDLWRIVMLYAPEGW